MATETERKGDVCMGFSAVFRPGMEDLGAGMLVKNRSLLRFCEDTAGFHTDTENVGLRGMGERGLAWVLLAWDLAVYRRPAYGKDLTVTTRVRQTNRVHSWRDFTITGPGGDLLAEATSRWIVVQTKDHAVVPMPEDILRLFPEESGGGLAGWRARRLDDLPEPEAQATTGILRSRTDMLGHLHNLEYLSMAEDMLPAEAGDPGLIDVVTLRFRNEVRAGDTVRCLFSSFEGGGRVDILGPKGISASVCFGREI